MYAAIALLPLFTSLVAVSPTLVVPTPVKRQTTTQSAYPVIGCFNTAWRSDASPEQHYTDPTSAGTYASCANACGVFTHGLGWTPYYGYLQGGVCECADYIDEAAQVDDSYCTVPCPDTYIVPPPNQTWDSSGSYAVALSQGTTTRPVAAIALLTGRPSRLRAPHLLLLPDMTSAVMKTRSPVLFERSTRSISSA